MFSSRAILISIILLALLVRGGVAFSNLSRFDTDPDAYRAISQTLAVTGVYGTSDDGGSARPTAFRPPLYPYVLSWMVVDGQLASFAVAGLHAVLGMITVALTFLTARRCMPSGRVGSSAVIAALLVMLDPILVQQSTLVMTETLATALVSIIVWWWVARCHTSPTVTSAVVLGGLMGLAFLCRPTFLVWAALMTIAWLGMPHLSWRQRVTRSGVFVLMVSVSLVGWTMRNQRTFAHPIWATTHGGYTLLLANNPLFYDYLESGTLGKSWDADPFLTAYTNRYEGDPNLESFWRRDWGQPAHSVTVESEVIDDRISFDAARSTIQRRPKMFAWSCLVRLGRLWSPLPYHSPDRSSIAVYAVGLYYVLFAALMVVGLWRLRWRGDRLRWWPTVTLIITLSAVHAVYWSNLRMRAPAMPLLAIVASAAFLPRKISPTTNDFRG